MAAHAGSEDLLLALLLDKISLHCSTSSRTNPAILTSPPLTAPPILQNPKTSSWDQPFAVLSLTGDSNQPPLHSGIGYHIKSGPTAPPSLYDSGYFSESYVNNHDDADNDPATLDDCCLSCEPWELVNRNGNEDQPLSLEAAPSDFDGEDQWNTIDKVTDDLVSTSRSIWLRSESIEHPVNIAGHSPGEDFQFAGTQFDAPVVFEKTSFDSFTIDFTVKGLSILSHLHSLLRYADQLHSIQVQFSDTPLQDCVSFKLAQFFRPKISLIRHFVKHLLNFKRATGLEIPRRRWRSLRRPCSPLPISEDTVSQSEPSSLAGSSSRFSSTGPATGTSAGSSGSGKKGTVWRFHKLTFKRTSQASDGGGDGDQGDEPDQHNDHNRHSGKRKPKSPTPRPHAWACPYSKLDPQHFGVGKYQSCKKHFSQWNAVRQHLRRVHYEPKQSCRRCLKVYPDKADRQAHVKKAECTERKFAAWERYVRRGSPRSKKLRRSTNIRRSKDDEADSENAELCWKRVWDVLFPDHVERYPEPIYHMSTSTEELSSTNEDDATRTRSFSTGPISASHPATVMQGSSGPGGLSGPQEFFPLDPAVQAAYPLRPQLNTIPAVNNQLQRQQTLDPTHRHYTVRSPRQSRPDFQPAQQLQNGYAPPQGHASLLEFDQMRLPEYDLGSFYQNLLPALPSNYRGFDAESDNLNSFATTSREAGGSVPDPMEDLRPSDWILNVFMPEQQMPSQQYYGHHDMNHQQQHQYQQSPMQWQQPLVQQPQTQRQQQPLQSQLSESAHWHQRSLQQPPQWQRQQQRQQYRNQPQQQCPHDS